MPIVCIALWFASLLIATPLAIEESKREQQVNQTTEEIQACKTILLKVGKQ